MRDGLTIALERGSRFLLWRAATGAEHPRILGQHRPPTKRESYVRRDNGAGCGLSRAFIRPPWLGPTKLLELVLTCCLDVLEVDKDTLSPILFLLDSPDIEVQRAASAALGNLAVNRKPRLLSRDDLKAPRILTHRTAENKVLIVQLGGLTPLIRQMLSPNVEVQCNAVGCITNLATHEANKAKIARSGALGPLTRLAKSRDMRVQRNATGALLNMTHSGMKKLNLEDPCSKLVVLTT